MARTALLRGVLERMGIPAVRRSPAFSVIKVERLLSELGIKGYEFDYEPRVVRVANGDDLVKILLHLMPSEVSNDTTLTITQSNGSQKFRIGSWQFESRD